MAIAGEAVTGGVTVNWSLTATPANVVGRLTADALQLQTSMRATAQITVSSAADAAGFLFSFVQLIRSGSYRTWYYRSTDGSRRRYELSRFGRDCLDGDPSMSFPWYVFPQRVTGTSLTMHFRDDPPNFKPLTNSHGDLLVKTGGIDTFALYLGVHDGEAFGVLGSLGWSVDWKSNVNHTRHEITSLQPLAIREEEQDSELINAVDQTRRANHASTRTAERGTWT
jgi:hypothetical protein